MKVVPITFEINALAITFTILGIIAWTGVFVLWVQRRRHPHHH